MTSSAPDSRFSLMPTVTPNRNTNTNRNTNSFESNLGFLSSPSSSSCFIFVYCLCYIFIDRRLAFFSLTFLDRFSKRYLYFAFIALSNRNSCKSSAALAMGLSNSSTVVPFEIGDYNSRAGAENVMSIDFSVCEPWRHFL